MKISTAALSFLILAAALGSLAHGSQPLRSQTLESMDEMFRPDLILPAAGVHRPTDCCISYTRQKIRCIFMKDYIERLMCRLPAIIFITMTGQQVCVNPVDRTVQRCIKILQKKKNARWQPPTFFPRTSSGSSLA
ncbi:C-C motif chemokine 15-like isoform X1 [Molossus molossus]|uniref:C-C motif chemokine 15-like isoform X1 n=1 Tax=Molossus molossus TaxID=27622 RepID=UPI00174772A7|nr:C-C motif chemokine 15-like isoform X1 [Molossus molossus]